MGKIGWFLLFLALLFAGDRVIGSILQKQALGSNFRYARLYRGEAAAELLLVGNSRGLTFYQPYIEEITGKSSFNLSYNGLPIDAAKALCLDYLDRYPVPRVTVIDITICDRPNDELLSGFLTFSGQVSHLDTLIGHKTPKPWWGGRISTLFCCNNEIFQRALFYRNKTDKDWLLDRQIPDKLAAQAEKNSYDLEIHPYLLQNLKERVAAIQSKGGKVELVIGPYFPKFQVPKLDALKNEVEKITGLPVRDYRNALTDESDFGDFMHPNKKGSIHYMDILHRDGVF